MQCSAQFLGHNGHSMNVSLPSPTSMWTQTPSRMDRDEIKQILQNLHYVHDDTPQGVFHHAEFFQLFHMFENAHKKKTLEKNNPQKYSQYPSYFWPWNYYSLCPKIPGTPQNSSTRSSPKEGALSILRGKLGLREPRVTRGLICEIHTAGKWLRQQETLQTHCWGRA